jgi:hypothetical protein
VTAPYDDVTALQTCLAAEHAAVYGYGAVGGRLAGTKATDDIVDRADQAYEWHRSQRDLLDHRLRDLGSDPIAAEPAYALPITPETVGQCERLARYVENRCSAAYAYAVGLAAPDRRGLLVANLGQSALLAAEWGARLTAFPGRPDL